MSRHGAILLELMISLAIFVMAALAIGGALRESTGALLRSREQVRAGDLARTAMARIEAGIARPEVINGPVRAWGADPDVWEGDELVDPEASLGIGAPDGGTGASEPAWELEVDSQPSRFRGLSIVRVRALRRDPRDPARVIASASLDQLVRLREAEKDIAGEEDELFADVPTAPAEVEP